VFKCYRQLSGGEGGEAHTVVGEEEEEERGRGRY